MTLDDLLTQLTHRYHAFHDDIDTLTIFKRLQSADRHAIKGMIQYLDSREKQRENGLQRRKDDFLTATQQKGIPERTAADMIRAKELNDAFFAP